MNTTCPCCGAPVAPGGDPEVMARQLTSPLLAAIVRALAVRPMTYEELVWSVYQGREPEYASNAVKVTIHRMGGRVEAFGWKIVRPGSGNRGPLYLMPLREAQDEVRA